MQHKPDGALPPLDFIKNRFTSGISCPQFVIKACKKEMWSVGQDGDYRCPFKWK